MIGKSDKSVEKLSWCGCGKSKGMPFCDGSHKGTLFVPVPLTGPQRERVLAERAASADGIAKRVEEPEVAAGDAE